MILAMGVSLFCFHAFPSRQVPTLTSHTSDYPLPVNSSPTDLHTGACKESPSIHHQQSTNMHKLHRSHTLNSPPFCKSRLTSPAPAQDPPPPSFFYANFVALRENMFGFSGESYQGFRGGNSMS